MPTQVLMPALSPTMEEGTLAKWLVKEGDEVSSGDLLAEIETDKATMEFEAVDEGKIGKILVDEGTEGVAVNTPIAVLLDDGESMDDVDLDDAGGGGDGGGDNGEAPDESAEPAEASEQTDPTGGYGRGGEADEGAQPGARANGRDTDLDDRTAPPAPQDDEGNRIFASPLARRIADQKGVDLTQIKGSGPRGRIVKADVEGAEPAKAADAPAEKEAKEAPKEEKAPQKAAPAGPSFEQVAASYEGRETEEVKLDGMRKTVAKRLTEAKQTIPHFYLRRDVRLDDLLSFRKDLNAKLESRGVKLSVNDFIIKAGALALQEVPDANAVWAGDRMLKVKPSDVAVAVALEGGGLFTPVIRDAHQKSLSVISAEMKDLAKRARDRKLSPQEYEGGTFAVSNLGMFGIDNFDAVINPPHGSILAIGAGAKKPVVDENGEVTVATVMSMTLSVDHRVIDGALGAEFLQAIVTNLENPIAMLA